MIRPFLHFILLLLSPFLGVAQPQHRSIHQEQSEYYSGYNFSSEKDWDALRVAENGTSPSLKKNESIQACTLNKRVFGWNPYWAGSAYNHYQWNLLSDLCHFSYEVIAASGQATSTHNWTTDAAVTAAKNNGVKIHLCATLFSSHATFLTSSTAMNTFITNIISLLNQRGANGVNIDFEGVPSAQSANFTAFMINLCNQVHAANTSYEVSIALPAVDWSAVYDVNAMKSYVDLFIIMGYDYYYGGSTTAGPSDPLYNYETSYNYTLTKSITYYLNKTVPNNKLLLGLPYYGEEWPTTNLTIPSTTTGTGSAKIYNAVRNNASGNYSTPKWDGTSYSVYYAFNSSGNHQCFINNAYSLGKRFDVVNQFGIGGIGIWALSYDDGYTDYWDKIKDKFSSCGAIACSDTIFDMGGPVRNYYDNENYTYTIAPAGATTLSLNFSSFTTETTNDYLKIYDGATTASTLLGTYSGTTSPGTINASGSALTLQWHSNSSTNNSGWYAIWNCNSSPAASLSVLQNTCPNISVVLNWQNSGNGWYADVTNDPTFTNYWSKSVSNLTSIGCPGGFANVTVTSNYLKFKPNTTYYWRIRNGSTHISGTPFTTSVCTTTDTNCTGTLDDSGGPSASYSGNEDYTYTIAPPFAASVTINFTAFDLENGFDSLYIHNGTSTAAPLLASSTGTVSPGTVTAGSGAMTLHFISDPFVNNTGFSSTWTCLQNTGVNENANDPDIIISPNPFSENTSLRITNPNELQITHLKIVDLVGREIKKYSIPNGAKNFTLEKGNLQAGIYFINLVSENKIVTTKKIIIQ